MNNFNNYRSKFYVGDSTAVTFVNSSSKLVFGAPYTTYRIRVLWEKMINGKMAIVESFRDSYLTSVSTINSGIPENFSLSQNYPNPFNPTTNLEFGISDLGFVTLKVFDIQGKEVSTLVNEKMNPGTYKIEFDGKGLPSGVYFYKLETAGFADTKRMILLK
ncbi:MAG: T9SS type A sorting domain-containing protein [Ignavibacteria bacterium]|nr:T9SS type A sorting domain-containing protein [Ignavibacteria bacterium]